MASIDLNADMGEYADDAQKACEAALMPLVSSCSIACGGHAGDEDTMRATARLAKRHGVQPGAHPSYPDREGFGRRSMTISQNVLFESLQQQIQDLKQILDTEEIPLAHVKVHGALYNDAAKDSALAALVINAAHNAAKEAVIVGPPQSALESKAREAGVRFAAEGFVDRLYQSSGALTPRSQPGAVIADLQARIQQTIAIALGEPFKGADGALSIRADTLCIHSDSPDAVATADAVRGALRAAGFTIRAFA